VGTGTQIRVRKGDNWTGSQWELRVMETLRVLCRYYEPKLVHVFIHEREMDD
jgi:hypothetical protein